MESIRSSGLFILTAILLVAISSCQYSDQFKTYSYLNEWQIHYPPYMRKSNSVFPGSEFQASNGYRDTYAFMRESLSGMPAKAVRDSLKEQLYTNLRDPRTEIDTTYLLDGVEFNTSRISGLLKDKRMYYLLSVISVDGRKFHFAAWMFHSKRSLWEEDFDTMLHSFEWKD